MSDTNAATGHSWGERVVGFLHRRALVTIVGLVIAAGGLGVMASRIKVDNSLRVWFVEGDPALVAYDEYKKTFGNDETIIVAATDPTSVYSPGALARIRAASKQIEQHPKIARVTSITNGLHVSGAEGFLEIVRLLEDGPITKETAAAVKKRVASNPAFRKVIAGNNETMTLLLVQPKTFENFDAERASILRDVEKIVDETLRKDGGGAHLGGIGVIYEGLNAASIRDSSVFVSVSYLVVLLGLWILFRSLVWVGMGLLIITISTVATVGLAGLAGRDMNMVTAVLPTLLMTIGILDFVHIVDAFQHERGEVGDKPTRRFLMGSLGVVIVPCVFNTITDIVGFLALTSAKMSAVRDLGWLAGAGLFMLLITVLVITVPALGRWGGTRGRPPRDNTFMTRLVDRLFCFARDRRALVFGGTGLLLAGSVVGIMRLDVDTYTIGFLPKDHPVRADHRAIEQQFGNYIPLEFTVSSPAKGGLKNPSVLARMNTMERAFEEHPAVSRATGLPEIVMRVNEVWNDEKKGTYVVPSRRGVVAEYLLNYSFSADGRDALDDVVGPDYRRTHVTLRTQLPTARGIQKNVAALQAIANKSFAGKAGAEADAGVITVEPAGYLPLYIHIIQHITETQVRSFSIAIVLVMLVLMLLLRSVKLGLLAMLPNLLPAVLTLGFMGYAGIRLDVATVLIAAIAIGISVNDTSHIMFRFKHELTLHPEDPERAVQRMMQTTGRAVVASSLILMAGFAVLMLASVKSIFFMGMLSSATILSALIADLIVTPALLLSLSRSK